MLEGVVHGGEVKRFAGVKDCRVAGAADAIGDGPYETLAILKYYKATERKGDDPFKGKTIVIRGRVATNTIAGGKRTITFKGGANDGSISCGTG